ncbi:double-stranded RNA-binding motif protein, partial [Trifolium medium]|nr:double-stranded RNA-binding motif protein [Trifolium medium]
MSVFHDFHVGSSAPTDEYGSKQKVEVSKPQKSSVPAKSPVIVT